MELHRHTICNSCNSKSFRLMIFQWDFSLRMNNSEINKVKNIHLSNFHKPSSNLSHNFNLNNSSCKLLHQINKHSLSLHLCKVKELTHSRCSHSRCSHSRCNSNRCLHRSSRCNRSSNSLHLGSTILRCKILSLQIKWLLVWEHKSAKESWRWLSIDIKRFWTVKKQDSLTFGTWLLLQARCSFSSSRSPSPSSIQCCWGETVKRISTCLRECTVSSLWTCPSSTSAMGGQTNLSTSTLRSTWPTCQTSNWITSPQYTREWKINRWQQLCRSSSRRSNHKQRSRWINRILKWSFILHWVKSRFHPSTTSSELYLYY